MKYKNLFEPIKLRGMLFRNRIFAAPTGFQDMGKEGILPPEAACYYERKAMGGAASVTVGECVVDSKFGKGSVYHICLDNPFSLHGLARTTDAITRQGAVASAELQHAGMYANRSLPVPGVAYGPVDYDDNGRQVRAMTEEFIEYTIGMYAKAARFAKQCGFGMLTIHGGHGWLISQFLSPTLNTRKDKWGGAPIENRARLAVAICKAVRKEVGPNFPLEIRISGSECYDGGYDIDEGIAFAKQIEDYVDLIHVSAGSHEVEEVFTVTHPSVFLEDGCNVKYAAAIKKHVRTPVATVGALGDPELMEEIIASGQADVVEIARGLIADPDLPLKARTGREQEIRKCLRCLACFSTLINRGQFYCAINPESGRERDMKFEIPPAQKKKVLVVGGGIAGMQAALTCAQRGHEVILCEKNNRLGGTLLCEEKVPFKKRLGEYLIQQAKAVEEAGVDIRLNTIVTPEYAMTVGADVIIAALGARPLKPSIPGIEDKNVLSAEKAYREPGIVGSRAVILGAGLVGMELGIYLAMLGRKVTIVEMMDEVNDGGNFQHLKALKVEFKRYQIDLHLSTKAVEINEKGVKCISSSDREIFFDADTVIYAVGQEPLREEASSLRFCAAEFYQIGDCVIPKDIMSATSTAHTIARNIGR
ncbi:MAG: FAD-dependent oxidoreductase [Peptococcaceae bacterium]|nr:FAD-dependent oxidoreductase [Peptococcaceae bacterium]